MSPSPLQLAYDQAIIGRCLAEAIEQSGLAHLVGAAPVAVPTVLRDLSSVRSAATRARNESLAAHARAVQLRLIAETIDEGAPRMLTPQRAAPSGAQAPVRGTGPSPRNTHGQSSPEQEDSHTT